MRIIRDDIDKWYDCDIDAQTRTLYMGSVDGVDDPTSGERYETGTDYQMAEKLIKGLHILDNKDLTGSRKEREITIIMNNLGGCEYHGLGMFDAIQCCRSYVTIKVFGQAMSMGSWILQAADERLVAPNATIMLHNGSWGGWDRGENNKDAIKEYDRLNDIMYGHYLARIHEKHPRYKKEKLEKMLHRRDVYMTAEQAVELGLADGIIPIGIDR